ncbi:glucose-6-phosphate dehydrogenase [Lentimicrobium sp.]
MPKSKDHIYVIFGASGDLTGRKLIPSIYALFIQQMLPVNFALLGVGRTKFSDNQFRDEMKAALHKFAEQEDKSRIDDFLEKIYYHAIEYNDISTYKTLKSRLEKLRYERGIGGNTVYYLSTPPVLYGVIPDNLAAVDLNRQQDGWKRLVIEKPFGYDLQSALDLKEKLLKHWTEAQLYRIDHYLGKETVQNVFITRFSNGIFEPLWNRNYIHHVEITSSESIGIEKRGGYYDSSGALRDMIQNHLLQVTGLIAMEPPSSLQADAIRNEILKVFQSLRPLKDEEIKHCAVRGQYLESIIHSEKVPGYRQEEDVSPTSTTETYAAIKFYIDNWRWGGVPFYVRTGKRLPTRVSEVVIHFKQTPHFLFSEKCVTPGNQLIIRIQPDEGILIRFGMKKPGEGYNVETVNMDFHYADLTEHRIPTAYERLIHDTMIGDATLFARTEELIETWKFLTPVLEKWKNDPTIPLYGYPAGTWGPDKADDLIEEKGITWRYPCKNLSNSDNYCKL